MNKEATDDLVARSCVPRHGSWIRAFRNFRSLDSTASGFTLLEVVVTLVLLGLAAALVAPTFRTETAPRDEFVTVLAQSREMAVRRAQTLVFEIDAQGRWKLTPVGDTTTIGSGVVQAGSVSVRMRITPMGVCLAEDNSMTGGWDAIACARASGSERR